MGDKKKNLPTQAGLIGKKIYLRPATADDIANTYHWFLQSDPPSQTCWPLPFRSASEAAELYRKKEKTPNEQLFMIIRSSDNMPVGQLRFFKLNTLNRSAELGLLVDPDERRHGFAVEATRLLCHYLFRVRDLNKVHAQTAEFNAGAIATLEKAGFKKDGTLRHHYFYEGELHHGLIYSMLRFEYEQ